MFGRMIKSGLFLTAVLAVTAFAGPASAVDPYVDTGFTPTTPRPDPDLVVVRERFYAAGGVDLSAYGLGGPHDYVQSVYFRLFIDNDEPSIDSFTGLVVFPESVTILGFIQDGADLGGEVDDGVWTASDAVFGIGSDPDRYSEGARGFETGGGAGKSEFIGQVTGHSFTFGLNVTDGVDDFRVIIDYGAEFGPDLSFDILSFDVGALGGAVPTEGIRIGDDTDPVVFGSGDFGETPSLRQIPLTSTTPPIPADAQPFDPLASLFFLRDTGTPAVVDGYDTGYDVPLPDLYTVSSGLSNPRGITDGNDGLLWCIGQGGGLIRIHPTPRVVTVFLLDDLGGSNTDITNLPGRPELFVSRDNGSASRIDVVDPTVPAIIGSLVLDPGLTNPVALTDGPDGLLYVVDTGGALQWMDGDGGSAGMTVLAPPSGSYMDVTGLPGSDLLYLLRDTSGDTAIDTYDTITGTAAYGFAAFPVPGSPIGITDGPGLMLNVLGLGSTGAAGFTVVDPADGSVLLSHAFMDFTGSNISLTNLAVQAPSGVGARPPVAADFPHAASPNPFNGGVEIAYELPVRAAEVAVYDLRGRLVRVLEQREVAPGEYAARWDGRDTAGGAVSSGTYVYRIRAGAEVAGGKVQLVR